MEDDSSWHNICVSYVNDKNDVLYTVWVKGQSKKEDKDQEYKFKILNFLSIIWLCVWE